MYLVSGLLIALAHYLSALYVETERSTMPQLESSLLEDSEAIWRLGGHLTVQGIISSVIAYLLGLDHWTKLPLLIYALPVLARPFIEDANTLYKVHNFSFMTTVLLLVFFIFNQIPPILDLVKDGIHKISLAVQVYGWIPFLVTMWFKILLPVQFLIFWSVLFVMQLYRYYSVSNHPIFTEGWMVVLLASVGECCVTPVSLVGVCVTISYISHLILTVTKLYLQGRDAFLQDGVMHRGWTEGFTMFLLSIQTGMIELKAAQRAFLMSIVLFIVLSSLIQSMFEITEPILLSLGASQSKKIARHVRAISLCTFLWLFPLYMTHAISQFFDLDFWLLIVISSCVLTSVQVIGSLVVYTLFMYDALRDTPWENLDDVVYYTKSTTRVLEFTVALFVVCYGVRESIFGDWSWINAAILIIHCYFNVWQRLQAGWKSYLLRRESVKKVESLPLATAQQLEELNDVCAICYQPLKTARVTRCNHFFHTLCLRKWLYVQDKCPMCHQEVTSGLETNTDTQSTENNADEAVAGIAADVDPAAAAAPEPEHVFQVDPDLN